MHVLDRLRAELLACCEDACLDARSLAAFVVTAPRPAGTTPMAYLQPSGLVLPDTVAVFRAAGADRVERQRLRAHRLALWRDLPGMPEAALGPMVRHELEHARRWERSGTPFFEADDLLRAAVRRAGGAGYATLPSELEANAASAAYAAGALSEAERTQVRAHRDCSSLVREAAPPADVVDATLAELAARDDWAAPAGVERSAYLAGIRSACAGWDPGTARSLVTARDGPTVELVPAAA